MSCCFPWYDSRITFVDNIMDHFVNMMMKDKFEKVSGTAKDWKFKDSHIAQQNKDDTALIAKSTAEFQKFAATAASLHYQELKLKSDDGYEVPVHVTVPKGKEHVLVGRSPESEMWCLVLFHGGGMFQDNALNSEHKGFVDKYGGRCAIITPEYRLSAGGHHYPIGIQDAMTAVRYAGEHFRKIVLMGYSAGGHLTTACALRALRDGIKIAHIFPGAANLHTNMDGSRPEMNTDVEFEKLVCALWKYAYLTDEDRAGGGDGMHDLRRWSWKGMPPATVVAGNFDPLFPDAKEIHERICSAGGTSEFVELRASHIYGATKWPAIVDEHLSKLLAAA